MGSTILTRFWCIFDAIAPAAAQALAALTRGVRVCSLDLYAIQFSSHWGENVDFRR